MRQLSDSELDRLEFLTSKSIEVALLEPTATGLEKSIMDATIGVRDFLSRVGAHHYENQKQGPENKVSIRTYILSENSSIETATSMYRPVTKNGDPRIWISGIKNLSQPGDILAIAFFESSLWVFNLTKLDLKAEMNSSTPFSKFVTEYSKTENSIAEELLQKMRAISSKGYIESPYKGDTAIGRLLETELGIAINSSKNPDYKGIELKSARSERNNRMNLFAQVPDWEISNLKSSREILDNFGYLDENGIHKLYCTVSGLVFNSQGLSLRVDDKKGLLNEISDKSPQDVVTWRMSKLEERLIEKHAKTFWVEADVKVKDGVEWFKFTKVEYTRDPMVAQLSVLLTEGKITVDHLIKEKRSSASEKGPIFKLSHNSLDLLFPPSDTYVLN